MTSRIDAAPRGSDSSIPFLVTRTMAAVLMLVLAACGGGGDKAASQTAAKVNKEEITVHQINFVMQQQRGLKPEQAETVSRQILERLIDQELEFQKAIDLKIDRDPRVVQQLQAARREVIARAYLEKTGEGAVKPSAEVIKKYYDEKPALFKARRIYSIQEVAIEAKPDQVAMLRTQLQGVKTIGEFIEYLKTNNFKFSGNQAVRPAEQLPLSMLDTFAGMKDGQAMLVPTATGAQVIVLAGSRAEPVDEVQARPAIEQFLLNDAKRKLIEADVKALRAASKIEYVGKFGEGAVPASAASAAATGPMPALSPVTTAAPLAMPAEPATAAAPVTQAPVSSDVASGGLDASSISKGLGLKK